MRTISHYRLEQELGRGGMGRVYKAYDLSLDRIVVLKLLAPDLVADKDSRTRFLREARLASALDHPNICTIYEIAEADDQYFIAMQYVPGKTLKQIIGGQALSLDSLFSIGFQTADALAAAHGSGIIHRDIKSGNIGITPRGQVKVFDFGLAKLLSDKGRSGGEDWVEAELTAMGSPLGTPTYMSPEQAACRRVDHRSDIYSFGVVLYEMATGDTPFRGASSVDTMHAVMNKPHRPAVDKNEKVPLQLSAVIDCALAKSPGDRYQSMPQMMEELRQAALSARFAAGIPYSSATPFVRPRRQTVFGAVGRWIDRFAAKDSRAGIAAGAAALAAPATAAHEDFSLSSSGGQPRSIAVLPLRNLSAAPAAEFYGLSLADGLITELAKNKSLSVKPSAAIAKYQNSSIDPRQVGKELDVEIMLTGSFLKTEDRLRVTVQLTDTHGAILWSEKIDAGAEDILTIQDRICERIVSGLGRQPAALDPMELLRDESEAIRLDAVRILEFSHDPRALSALIEALRDPALKVKAAAVEAIVKLGEEATGPVIRVLTDAVDEGDRLTARFAANALGSIGEKSISPVLIELLTTGDSFVVCEAVLALGRLGETKAVPELIALLNSPSGNIRFAAAEAIGQICDQRALEALQTRLGDDDEGVRAKARWALNRLRKRATINS